MTNHYADAGELPSSLDKDDYWFAVDATAALTLARNTGYFGRMSTRDTIINKLAAAFAPTSLDVVDESHHHEGHAGHRPGGESHYRVYIVSESFRGKSRIERHRMVNEILAAELKGGVHALAIKASAPGEGAA